jgi:hypothetical protein
VLPQASANPDWNGDDRAALAWLVEHFDRDPSNSRVLIREMLEADPAGFVPKAVAVLRERPESRGSQYVVTLLVANDLLIAALCEPSLDREQAVALARCALRVDSMADMTLAKALVSRDQGTVADPARLMDILDEISGGTRILPSLLRLLRHDDPHIRSKAVLMIGRGSRGVRWVERRLADEDPRVRANAIESMWGLDRPEARSLLQKAQRDPNNRVAGNAILGLYLLGDCSSIPELLKLNESESPVWRATATWVMGETGDPRFLNAIAEGLRDADAMVRRRAYWALGRVKAAAAKVAQTGEWRMAGHFCPPERGSKNRCVRLAIGSAERQEIPAILPTQFLLSEDGQPVIRYQVADHVVPSALSVAFVFPKSVGRARPPWVEGALRALRWKRNSDLWGTAPYLAEALWQSGPPPPAAEEMVFCGNPDAIENAFLHPVGAGSCTDIWNATWNAVKGLERLVRGENRIILFSNSRESRAAGLALLSSVIMSSTRVQAISTEDNPRLEDFCAKTRGLYRRVQSEDEAAAAIGQACLQLLARYEISYSPVLPEGRNLKARAHTPAGWAEITLAIPPPQDTPPQDRCG